MGRFFCINSTVSYKCNMNKMLFLDLHKHCMNSQASYAVSGEYIIFCLETNAIFILSTILIAGVGFTVFYLWIIFNKTRITISN
jgi:hypothetical protein